MQYQHITLSDRKVISLLEKARGWVHTPPAAGPRPAFRSKSPFLTAHVIDEARPQRLSEEFIFNRFMSKNLYFSGSSSRVWSE